MEYQEFKSRLMEALNKVLPGEQGYRISTRKDQGKEFLAVQRPDRELSAEMSLRNLYQIAEMPGQDLHSLAEMVQDTVKEAEQVVEAAERINSIDMKSYESVKSYLRLELTRSEQNGVFLSNGIFEKQAFGALVPFVSVPFTKGEVRTQVTLDMLETYGITQKELMKQAMKNTQAERPLQILKYEESGDIYYAVTTHARDGGATAVMYPGVLEELHQKIGTDYYVVPLNVQGVLAVEKNGHVTAEQLRKSLLAENRSNEPDKWLSSKICEYNGEEKKLSVCKTDKIKRQER